MDDKKQIRLEENGELLAEATISVHAEDRDASAQVTVAPGHLPAGTRQRMADAVHEAVCAEPAEHMTASVPLGDVELVDGIRRHLTDPSLHAAGASSIIEGQINRPDRSTSRPE